MVTVIRGAVQGVGFRPFVFRLARELGLRGWVSNSMAGVEIEVEGPVAALEAFRLRLSGEKPARAFFQSIETSVLEPVGHTEFVIRESRSGGTEIPVILPDIAACPDCVREIFDVANRRYLYPFTNCTNCGPRYSIIESLPYDRAGTSMKSFTMCPACRHEYEDPSDRRFHAQPNACPVCGPHLELWSRDGKALFIHREALLHAVKALRAGQIVAVKGMGGFQLLVDAGNEQAVRELRRRKRREEKPFAVMAPTLAHVRTVCSVSGPEEQLLSAPEAPIVLLDRLEPLERPGRIASSIAPGNPCLGFMLPTTPLHHILLRELGTIVVATSGNLSEEPLCTDEHEALERLHGIADVFLVHDRPIVRPGDDSIARVILGRELILRRARGYAPLPLTLQGTGEPALAVGAHLKNTIALGHGTSAFVSQHIGDLETQQAFEAFRNTEHDLRALLPVGPQTIVCDSHPDYLSTKFAEQSGMPLVRVQHHYAHMAACMAENRIEGPLLGVVWDGTGYGSDGTIWGGEFLAPTDASFERRATLRTFRLPGGDQAVREPRRAAIGLLHEVFGDVVFHDRQILSGAAFRGEAISVLREMIIKGINAPRTSSVGRLFDAVASLSGIRQISSFEGQAAMELEFAARAASPTDESYDFLVSDLQSPTVIDWIPMIMEILGDLERSVSRETVAAKFHNTLIEIILSVARRAMEQRVLLTGGCFQNRYLLERAVRLLSAEGFDVAWPQRVPPNDGGISLGQLYALRRAAATVAATCKEEYEEPAF